MTLNNGRTEPSMLGLVPMVIEQAVEVRERMIFTLDY